MISRLVLALHLGCFAMAGSAKTVSANPLASVKAAKNQEQLRAALLRLGVPAKILDSLRGDTAILSPSKLKRAETFKANLDEDADKESVTQVVFEGTASGTADETPRLYLILVHDGKAEGAPMDFRMFDMTYCGYSQRGGMKFSFVGKARKDIVFNLVLVASCGTTVASSDETDTLNFSNGKSRYVAGPKSGGDETDRLDLPEP